MAMRASVTVSIAADITGRFSRMSRVSWVDVSTSLGRTDESAGRSMTSSNVSPSLPNFSS